MRLRDKLIVAIIAILFCVVSIVGSLTPTSEMEKRIEQLQDHNYRVTKGDWDAILSLYTYPGGSVDNFGCEYVYASYDDWDKFEKMSENIYALCVDIGVGSVFKVWYDESRNRIFFLAPASIVPDETNYIVFYTTKN